MAQVFPEKQERVDRMQYFVDTYLKDIPVLGLEYVVEEQVGSSYVYTCMLCNKEDEWQEMVSHITDLEHVECYVSRHHSDMNTSTTVLTKEERIILLMNAAKSIHAMLGRSEIRMKKSNAGNPGLDVVAGPSPEEGSKKNGALPTTSNDLQMEDVKERLPWDPVPQDKGLDLMFAQGVESRQEFQKYTCTPCSVNCSSAVALCQHVIGNKHKRKLHIPQKQNNVNRLSYFLNTYVKEDPIVGLEYVMELEGSSYKYSCQLCSVVNVNLMKIVGHITGPDHTELYILNHCPDLMPLKHDLQKPSFTKALRDACARIIKLQGRKEIQVNFTTVSLTQSELFPQVDGETRKAFEDTLPSKPEGDSKTRKAFKDTLPSKLKGDSKRRKAFKDTLPSKYESRSSHSKRRPLPYRETGLDESRESYRYNQRSKEYKSNDPPLAKRSRRSPECDWDALTSRPRISKHKSSHYNESHAFRLNCPTATQALEFRTNGEFLEYLANFVISDDEDAVFIQKITQNCITALTNFKVEEAERQESSHWSETLLAHTSRDAQEIPGILNYKTESHSLSSETILLKDTPNATSDSIPKNEVTDFFFNSIKNMDESEVVGVFQKIATTNPEFQGMDIPAVIRYLKDSGRLKKP